MEQVCAKCNHEVWQRKVAIWWSKFLDREESQKVFRKANMFLLETEDNSEHHQKSFSAELLHTNEIIVLLKAHRLTWKVGHPKMAGLKFISINHEKPGELRWLDTYCGFDTESAIRERINPLEGAFDSFKEDLGIDMLEVFLDLNTKYLNSKK